MHYIDSVLLLYMKHAHVANVRLYASTFEQPSRITKQLYSYILVYLSIYKYI
jgi:hypothetical protein